MMAPDRSRPLPNLINLRSDGMARDLPASFARKAFEQNFPEYLRKVRRINNPGRFGLYSVSDVAPERFGSVVLKGREELVFDPQPHLRPHLLEVEVENILRYRPLTTALTGVISRSVGIGRTAIAEYVRRAAVIGITWPIPEELDDTALERKLFARAGYNPARSKPLPDWGHVHAELRRRGVTLALLWEESQT